MRALTVIFLTFLSACGTDMGIGRSDVVVPDANIVDVLVATTRNPDQKPVEFGVDRADAASYASYRVSIPPGHKPGRIEWPETLHADPAVSFATLGSQDFVTKQALVAHLNTRLAKQIPTERGVYLFVHGYNNSFAEALYATAQIHVDYERRLIPIHFSWASAGKPGLYAYDQDSALIARDALADLLSGLLSSQAGQIEIIAHSMGALVVMEALRLLPPKDLARLRARMGNITLLSPDLDPDVFKAQIKKIAPIPKPFFLLTTQKDLVLRFSSWLRGGSRRVGLREEDFDDLKALGVTPLDITTFANGDNFNHTIFNNPDLIDFVVELAQNRRGRRLNLEALAQARIEQR